MNVAGKIVVVTGGAHGIGRALVERLEYMAHKAENYDRWLGGMAKLRRSLR